jgi:hypothetical protein
LTPGESRGAEPTQARAWLLACEQAEMMGMFGRSRKNGD